MEMICRPGSNKETCVINEKSKIEDGILIAMYRDGKRYSMQMEIKRKLE